MGECSIDAVREKLKHLGDNVGLEEAVTGKGIRIKAGKKLSLSELPREALEALLDCEVVEIVEPDGRIVYLTRDWVRRVFEIASAKSDSSKG